MKNYYLVIVAAIFLLFHKLGVSLTPRDCALLFVLWIVYGLVDLLFFAIRALWGRTPKVKR